MSDMADEGLAPDELALVDRVVDDNFGDPAEVEGAAAPEAGASDPPGSGEPAEEAAAPWAGIPQTEWEQTQQALAWMMQTLSPLAEAQQQVQQPMASELPELDPFDPESVAAYTDARVQAGIERALAPLMPTLQSSQAQQAESTVTGWLNEAEQRIGEYDKEAAAYVAHGFLPFAQGDSRMAVHQAADYIARRDKDVGAKAVEQYKQSLTAASQRPAAPGSGGGAPALSVVTHEQGDDELAIARKFAERATG